MSKSEPIFNVPRVVVGSLALIVLVHAGRSLLSIYHDNLVVYYLAFIPARYGAEGALLPGWPGALFWSPFTHALLHGDLTHLMLNSAWLLAVGTLAARRLGGGRFLLFSALCAAAGALGFYVSNPNLAVPMVGASGALSGLMAAVFRLIFSARDDWSRWLLREDPRRIAPLSLGETFQDRGALMAIVIWVGINLLFGVLLQGVLVPGEIAWEAHLGGFFFGLFAFGLFDRRAPEHLPPPGVDDITYH